MPSPLRPCPGASSYPWSRDKRNALPKHFIFIVVIREIGVVNVKVKKEKKWLAVPWIHSLEETFGGLILIQWNL